MNDDRIIRFSATVLLLAALLAFFGVTCAKADCYDCLVSTRAADAKAPHRVSDGDIVDCKPCGGQWGNEERKPAKFKIVTIEAKPEEVRALTAPIADKDGQTIKKRRFKAMKVDDKVIFGDGVSGQAVTPAEAKAAVEMEKKELSPETAK